MRSAADREELLMAELRGLFADVDPVPPMVLETAKASLGWRRPDVALEELLSPAGLTIHIHNAG